MDIDDKTIKTYSFIVDKALLDIKARAFKSESQIDFESIRQEGLMALLRALKNYNESKGLFSNYTYTVVYRAMYHKFKKDLKLDYLIPIDRVVDTLSYVDLIDDKLELELIQNNVLKSKLSKRNKQLILDRLNGAKITELKKKYNISYQRIYEIFNRTKEIVTRGIE